MGVVHTSFTKELSGGKKNGKPGDSEIWVHFLC